MGNASSALFWHYIPFAVKCWTDVSDSSCNLFRRKPASANLPLVESNKMSLEPVHYIWFARGYCLAFLTMLPNKSQKIWIHFELKWNKTGKKGQTKKTPKSRLRRLLDIFLLDMKPAIYKTKIFLKNPKIVPLIFFLFLLNILIFFLDRNPIAAYTYTTSAVLIINI